MVAKHILSAVVGLAIGCLCTGLVNAQLPIVHFVGIADTEAEGIGEHVATALFKVSSAMLSGLPKERYVQHAALVGEKCEINTIINSFRNLQINQGDTVLIYYAGHGAFDPAHGTLFLPHNNPRSALRMRTIIDEVESKKPRLIVIMPDCCQTPISGSTTRLKMAYTMEGEKTVVPPLEQSLFFDAEPGTVILFATERGKPVPCGLPMGDSVLPGTLFSEALQESMRSANLGAVGWNGFSREVKRRVNDKFATHKRDSEGRLILSNNTHVDIKNQRVWAQWIQPSGKVVTFLDPDGR